MFILRRSRIEAESQSNRNCNSRLTRVARLAEGSAHAAVSRRLCTHRNINVML